MRRYALAWIVAGVGCTPGLASGILQVSTSSALGGGELRNCSNEAPPCTDTFGEARQRCLAARPRPRTPCTDEGSVDEATELRRERENAAIRETGAKLARERAAAPARERSRCLGAPARSSSAPAAAGSADDERPPQLDRDMIAAGVTQVTTEVMSCRSRSPIKGQVLVSVKVAAEGCVIAVTVQRTPDRVLGSCVAAAIQNATFAVTKAGGSFRYPFVF